MKTHKTKPTRCKRVSYYQTHCWYDFEGGGYCDYRRSPEYVRHSFWDSCRGDFRAAHAIRVGATRCERSTGAEMLHNRVESTGTCRKNRRPKYWSVSHGDIEMLPIWVDVYHNYNSCEFVSKCANDEGEVCHA